LGECVNFESDEDARHKADKVYNLGKKIQKLRKFEQAIENLQNSERVLNNIDKNIGDDRLDTVKLLIELAKSLLRCRISVQPMILYYLNQAEEICKEQQLPLLTEIQKNQADLQEN
jgi:hypothetical protein